MVDIHKEKVARREIGQLASAKNVVRAHKIQTPSQKERQQKYVRIKLDLNSLDQVGHGIKTGDTTSSVMDKRPSISVSDGRLCSMSRVMYIDVFWFDISESRFT